MKKSDLIIKKANGLSGNDFLNGYSGHGLKDPCYSIYLGKWQIAQILFNSRHNKWYLSNTWSKFSSFDGAIKGLLKRINSK